MKRFCLIMLVLLMLSSEVALAAKARSIASETDSAYHADHLSKHLGESTCHATGNYIKTRNKANGSKVIGHLEQADTFILLDVSKEWAKIEVIHSDKTSPDSWDGMIGWVDSDYIDCLCSSSDYSDSYTLANQTSPWKLAYREYLSKNGINKPFSDDAVYWFAYINDDDIPELIIDTQTIAGGCHVLTYCNGNVDGTLIGSTGTPAYIERENLLLDSAGHQGNYYDAVYTITNGKWQQIYYAENIQSLPISETEHKVNHIYYIDNQKVSKQEYYIKLNSYFDTDNSIKLLYGKSFDLLGQELH